MKNLLRATSKKRFFRTRFDSQHVKPSQILAKAPWERFYHVFSSFSCKLIWKMSPLVLAEISGVFVYTLTSYGKYPVPGCENFQLPIQMILSEKQKSFFQLFVHFLDSTSNFENFQTKMTVIANVLPILKTVKILVRPFSKKRCFRTRFDSQHVKALQMLAKSPWERFYHVFSSISWKLISKMSPLVSSEILGLSVNTFKSDGTYSRLWESATPNSNASIWKAKNFFRILCSISGFYRKLWTFWKKRWSP